MLTTVLLLKKWGFSFPHFIHIFNKRYWKQVDIGLSQGHRKYVYVYIVFLNKYKECEKLEITKFGKTSMIIPTTHT